MCENRRFSEMRRERVKEPKRRDIHTKCVILDRSAPALWYYNIGNIGDMMRGDVNTLTVDTTKVLAP